LKYHICFFILLFAGCGSSEKASVVYQAGMKEYQDKKLELAEKSFSEVIKLDKNFLNAYLMLAKIHYYNKDYERSLNDVSSILDRNPDHTGGLYWKGRVLIISGKDDSNEPVNCLKKVLENDSHHTPARMLLALVYEKNGKYKEALHEYLTALEDEENLISARGNLAVLYRRLGLKDRAVQEINRAVRIAEVTGRDSRTLNLIKSEFEKWEEK
jgi:tetratricopeptide (TPR) repeat protein